MSDSLDPYEGDYCEECNCYDGIHVYDASECSCECCYSDEEDVICPHGFAYDEDCGVEYRRGIETCEFMCPWNRLG